MARYFMKCRSVYALDEALYFKRQHTNNLSIGFTDHAVKPMMLGHEAYKIFLSDGSAEDNLRLDNQFRDEMIGSIVRLYHPQLALTKQEKTSNISQIIDSPAFKKVVKGYKVKKGQSRLLAWSIRTRCIPLIKFAAKSRARKRYVNE